MARTLVKQIIDNRKNLLINSNFNFWQRGTSITVANTVSTYLADRWYVKNSLGTNGVITYSQVAAVNSGSVFGAKVQITTAPTAAQTNGTELYQVLENSDSLQTIGQLLSAGMLVKSFGNVNQIGIQFAYATTEVKPTLFLGTETLVTVNSATFTSATAIAQAVNNSPTNSGVVGIRIRITGVSTGNLYDLNNGFVVEQVMMNIGASVAPYQMAGRNIQEELAMCQRYYEKSYNLTTAPGAAGPNPTSGGSFYNVDTASSVGTSSFKIMKRVTPTVVVYSSSTGTINTARSAMTSADIPVVANDITTYGITRIAGTLVTGHVLTCNWTADAEI